VYVLSLSYSLLLFRLVSRVGYFQSGFDHSFYFLSLFFIFLSWHFLFSDFLLRNVTPFFMASSVPIRFSILFLWTGFFFPPQPDEKMHIHIQTFRFDRDPFLLCILSFKLAFDVPFFTRHFLWRRFLLILFTSPMCLPFCCPAGSVSASFSEGRLVP